ncbi:hypothetical protein J3P95_15990 [Pseudomonas sp. Z5-35]|uniref:hypothetical protein n=1 Tax=unclassified Pseudomonas TaxID=196821 RepID=UPI003DA7B0CA
MSESLKAPNIRELSLPLVGRQLAIGTKPMGGSMDPKTPLQITAMPLESISGLHCKTLLHRPTP